MDKQQNTVGKLTPTGVFHGRYRVERCLRAGGMGMVCEVTDLNTQRRRALKIMLPECVSDPALRERFAHEATITAQVDSEHLVEIFDAGVDEATGMPFILMELLKGRDLGDVLCERTRLPADELVLLLHQASQALDRTHALGIVHRDLKPENLFLTRRDDGSPRLRILDFGIAKLLTESTRWKTTGVLGSPLYMAPEQTTGDATIGPAADIYALGHIAFTLLAGEAFWEETARRLGSPVVLLAHIVQGPRQTATERAAELGVPLPPSMDIWFGKATASSPRDRFETASELVKALAEALHVQLLDNAARDPDLSGHVPGSTPPRAGAQGTCGALSTDRASTMSVRSRLTAPIPIAAALVTVLVVGVFVVPRLRSRAATQLDASSGASGEYLVDSARAATLPAEPAASEPSASSSTPPEPLPVIAPAPCATPPPGNRSAASPKPRASTSSAPPIPGPDSVESSTPLPRASDPSDMF